MTEPTYTQQTWHDSPTADTPISSARLGVVEDGVHTATDRASKSIRYDTGQALNPTQQALARGNLALGTASTGQATDYRPALTPTYVGARSKGFDARSSVYNATAANLRNLRALVSSTRQGGTARISCVGDSTTAGSGATAALSWPIQLRALLAASGCPLKGTGFVYANQGVTDPRWTSTGTVTGAGTFAQMSAAATKTFVSDLAGTSVDVRFYRNSGAFSITVDGAAPSSGVSITGGSYTTGTITPDGSLSPGVVTFAGLANTTHTVVVTSTATTYYIGINVYGAAGLQVSNVGVASTKVADWLPTGFVSDFQMATQEPADAFFLTLDVNDSSGATVIATYKANLQTIATNLKAIAPVMLIAGMNASGISSTLHQPYVSAMYDVADALDLPLLDLFHRWGSFSAANLLGLTADTVHPNPKGYADWAQAVYQGAQLGA